ncbi:DUF222 domain-containing protein [Actinoplanes sp. NPDC051494]|uniref:HNH endonuclease signature motif containing protein n=1 Tax=Actinoplanes sp. NPDC051494 TaxID=3363907 RepID=UPI00378C8846
MVGDVEQVGKEAAELAAAPLCSLPDHEIIDLLRAAHHLEQVAVVLQSRLVREADIRKLPRTQGARSLAAWLRHVLLLDPQPARLLADQASAPPRPAIEQAVLDGQVNVRQAAVITATVQSIPSDLAALTTANPGTLGGVNVPKIVRDAETIMLAYAGQFPAYQLRRIGERILAHAAPHLADQADEAALARQEARNHRRRGLTFSLPVEGLVRVSGLLGAEEAATVNAALHPLCKPVPDDTRTPAQRRADALISVCALALRTTELPDDGAEPPQLAVTVAYDPLMCALGAATTDTGERLSAATARRLACDARILPIVLGSAGQILDMGRTSRTAGKVLRRALRLRDRGCAFPGCDRPPRWTDAHHVDHWIDGGPTSLDNMVLLCRHHHRLIHHPTAGWTIRIGSEGHPEFVPPFTIDPTQRPRRNLYHLRI